MDRVLAALQGQEVDRVPVSAWWHDFAREWSPQGLAAHTLESYRRYGWDFLKVNPRATYYAEAWGARFRPRPDAAPELIEPLIRSAEDLARIRPLDPEGGPLGEQLAALEIIARDLAGEAPFIQTVFCPLAVVSRMAGSTEAVQRLMREHPSRLLDALEAITSTLAPYARACLARGASGIFLATVEWGSQEVISPEDHDRFSRPFDLRILEGVRGAPFNVLHVCRANNLLEHLLDYPVAAFHWAPHQRANPSLSYIAVRTDRAVMGGVSQDTTLASGSPEAVVAEARAAIRETGGRRFLLAPGCAANPRSPEANLQALAEAPRL